MAGCLGGVYVVLTDRFGCISVVLVDSLNAQICLVDRIGGAYFVLVGVLVAYISFCFVGVCVVLSGSFVW